jgi:uncharacterized membrane protein
MKTRRRHLWEKLKATYWFLPTMMMLAAAGLAITSIALDQHALQDERYMRFLYAGGIEGARTLLAALAGSVVTVAGVVFSITIATLPQASRQLRNVIRDTGNQLVLGTFTATFIYCLLVLRSIGSEERAVPHLSVGIAVLLAVMSTCVLIYFIHHISFSLQAPQVAWTAWREIEQSLQHMFPEGLGSDGPAPADAREGDSPPEDPPMGAITISAPRAGYVQAIDKTRMMQLACQRDVRMKMLCRPGLYVIQGGPLMQVWPTARVDPASAEQMQELFILGRYRTPEQDVEFGINQMAELAVRALSPGINDPFTATTCIDWLADALVRIAKGDLHSPYRYDSSGKLRVYANISTFSGLVDAAFHPIRQYGHTSPMVTIRLLEALAAMAPHMQAEQQRQALRRHAQLIFSDACDGEKESSDRDDIINRYRRALQALGGMEQLQQQPSTKPALPV